MKADNVTLKEAIEVVRKQGNYSFLIRNNDIDLNKKVSVNVDKGTINDVMAQLLTGTGISYEVNGNPGWSYSMPQCLKRNRKKRLS